jgi:glycosyltransferase involved in cell wall biosynthesis
VRIAHVAPSSERVASGVQTVVEEVVTVLGGRGHDVELWHVGDWTPPLDAEVADRLRSAGVRCRRLASSWRRGRPLPRVEVPSTAPVDVLHLHSVFVPTNAAVARGWPGAVVLSPHGGYDPVSLRRSLLRKQVYSALYERRLVRRADTVVALTGIEAEQVCGFAGAVRTAVVPNGVAPRPAGDGAGLRRRLDISADARLAVFVGRLDVRHKGLDRLVRAAAAAPGWRFLLVGPDHRGGRAELLRLLAGSAAGGRVELAGELPPADLPGVYAAADLFVLPSRWEGLPMSLLEALGAGVPALVSPEVDRLVPVRARGAGWVSAPDDLGVTLEALVTAPATEWSRRAAAARDLARDYDWDAVARSYEEVYEAAVRRWRAGGGPVHRTLPR